MIRLDGGLGTMLQRRGLLAGKDPIDWNIENPNAILSVHNEYVDAGADIILTNTFGANSLKYHGKHPLSQLITAACTLARNSKAKKVALDIGPTGCMLKPNGNVDFETAYTAFADLVKCGAGNVDLLFIETISDVMELKAAVLAAKETCDLPIYVTVSIDEAGKLLTGGSIRCVSTLLESLGVDAYGFNCGLGPDKMLPYVKELAQISTKPIIVKPNAGMPKLVNGKTLYDISVKEFSQHINNLIQAGATIVGGCCGTTPEYIAAIELNGRSVHNMAKPRTGISSGCIDLELSPYKGVIIGERINPTGKKLLKEAYRTGDTAYILREAVKQVESGAVALDINCGIPGIDEAKVLDSTISVVQSVVTCPLQIDTADPNALALALRHVNGKPLINSVNGKRESMAAVFPLVCRYGGVIVALCLDESGIPSTSDGRIAIAKRILAEGAKYGLREEDFIFDALTLAVSSDPTAAVVTLETVKRLTEELKVNTILGVSNVSFGLPNRAVLNNAMYTLAKRAGLSAAIANPSLITECDDQSAIDVLLGKDHNCENWIANNAIAPNAKEAAVATNKPDVTIHYSIVKGLKMDAQNATRAYLAMGHRPMEIVSECIVPALEEVGTGFEQGRMFLPQLLMAADAAGAAFEIIKTSLSGEKLQERKCDRPIVLATVKGDVHDIGKNIVRALLENYGFDVIDLGRDVAPERIVEVALNTHAIMVGLSALMTTTVGAMAETINQLKAAHADCHTCVGGAVVTQEYADSIGADYYAKDAMRTVRIAESLSALAKSEK